MFADRTDPRDRATSLIAVAAIHLALGYALISGLAVDLPRQVSDSLTLFAVVPPPPPPAPPPPKPRRPSDRAPRKEGAASPANLTAKATPIVAPPPVVVLPPPPPPVIAAPKAGEGAADHAGAAPVPGPGSGSGGIGNGTGSGDSGDGPGGGGGGEGFELISGRIKDSDFPRGAPEDGRTRRVFVRFVVGTNGRISNCRVVEPSDSSILNDATCGLLTKRLKFRPTRDARGKAVSDYAFWEQTWTTDIREPVEDRDDR